MIFIFKLSNGHMAIAADASSLEEAQSEIAPMLEQNGITIEEVLQGVDPASLEELQNGQRQFARETAQNLVSIGLRNIRLMGRVHELEASAAEEAEKRDSDDISLIATVLLWQQGVNIEEVDPEHLSGAMQSAEAVMTGMAIGLEAARHERGHYDPQPEKAVTRPQDTFGEMDS